MARTTEPAVHGVVIAVENVTNRGTERTETRSRFARAGPEPRAGGVEPFEGSAGDKYDVKKPTSPSCGRRSCRWPPAPRTATKGRKLFVRGSTWNVPGRSCSYVMLGCVPAATNRLRAASVTCSPVAFQLPFSPTGSWRSNSTASRAPDGSGMQATGESFSMKRTPSSWNFTISS